MAAQNIRVAVRVRPFSEKEKEAGAKRVVSMSKNTTYLQNPNVPNEKPKEFTFDCSMWSHDGFKVNKDGYSESDGSNSSYIDQNKLYKELGEEMLKTAWEGYNCSIFAYGQTGSGKSYSIMGSDTNKGLVPQMCSNLFNQQRKNVHIRFSMLEIYNEEVRDLLVKFEKGKGKKKLSVRENNEKGFYAEGLTKRPVANYSDLITSMNEGNINRSIAATKMNDTSSRAHTIVTIYIQQQDLTTKMTKSSDINLVDLAGSERQKQTATTGDRFKEATNINQSLSNLGNVIKALCDIQKKGSTGIAIRYRDSQLTKLLKNAIGGNSRTVMIAAIGPAADNYEQTLSTLKYADRAKSIRNHAKLNETATDQIVKNLKEEIERLKKETTGTSMTDEQRQEMEREHEEKMANLQQEIRDMEKSWEERLTEERAAAEKRLSEAEAESRKKLTTPYLWNLNEDPSLCGKVLHFLEGTQKVGSYKAEPPADIILSGPSIAPEHCKVKQEAGRMSVTPKNGLVYVNGNQVTEKTRLNHYDRVKFGACIIFVVHDPSVEKRCKEKGKQREITYEYAQKELAKDFMNNLDDKDTALLENDILHLLPMVEEANAISGDLQKHCSFEIILISPAVRGKTDGHTEVTVRMTDLKSGNKYMWERNKFIGRHSAMSELYDKYCEEGVQLVTQNVDDPFWEPADLECLMGIASIPLFTLSSMTPYDDTLAIFDLEGESAGNLAVEILPCNKDGKELQDDDEPFIESSSELVGQAWHIRIRILKAMTIPKNFKETWCSFKFFENKRPFTSRSVTDSINPDYAFDEMITIKKATQDFANYVDNEDVFIEIWGYQSLEEGGGSRASSAGNRQSSELAKLRSVNTVLNDCLNKIIEITDGMYCDECDGEILEIKKAIEEAKIDAQA